MIVENVPVGKIKMFSVREYDLMFVSGVHKVFHNKDTNKRTHPEGIGFCPRVSHLILL